MDTNNVNPLETSQNTPEVPMRPVQQGDASMEARPAGQPDDKPPVQADQRGPQSATPQSNQDPTAAPIAQRPKKPSVFDSVLRNLDPTTKIDPATGQPLPMPSRKSMTAHILAGAITSIIQGAQKGAAAAATAPEGPAGTKGPANLAAMGAGAQAGANTRDNIRNLPFQRQEEQQLRQYNTMKRNIDLHSSMLNLGQLQHQDMMTAIQPSIDTYNQAKMFDTGVTDPSKKLILDEGLTGAQAMEKYKGKMGMNDFIPMGTKKMFNPDGSPSIDEETGIQHEEPIFAVVNPGATLPATDEIKERLKYMNPEASKIPNNAQVRISSIMAANSFHTNQAILQDAGAAWGKEISTITGDKSLENVDLGKLARENKTIRDGMKYINNYNHLPIDQALAALGKDKEAQKAAPGVEGILAHALGMDKVNDRGQKMSELINLRRAAELAKQKSDEEVDRRKQDNEERRNLHEQEMRDSQDLKLKAVEPSTNSTQAFPNNWKDPKTGINYDLSHPAMKLVDGTMSPPQLSKRSKDYNKVIQDADNYSQAKFGKAFDFETAERDWKYAGQKSTQDTLNLVQSLTGEGGENNSGTLAQLQRQYAALQNTDFRDFNSAKQWLEQHKGDPGVPAFSATMFGVADEMAKILGGGTATVEGFKQAQAVLDRVFSDRASKASLDAVRGNMANRANGMIGDNLYLTKKYGKMRNPNEPNDVPTINGVRPVKQKMVNGSMVYMLPTGVIVDRRGRTMDMK